MDTAKGKILRAAVAFFVVLYACTALSAGVETLMAPAVTAVRVQRGTVAERRDFAATLTPAGDGYTIQWQMGEGEVDLLEGGSGRCCFFTRTETGLQRAEGRCAEMTAGAQQTDGTYTVTATLEAEAPPDTSQPVWVILKRFTSGVQTVPVAAISYVNGAACLMRLVPAAGGWTVEAQQVSVERSNSYVAAVNIVTNFETGAQYACGAYQDLRDGEKVRVIEDETPE